MQVDLSPYSNKKICVALSGGRDSMALFHYLLNHAKEYNITLCALNCDHSIRGEESARDSAFVKAYCASYGVPLFFFKAEEGQFSSENDARIWRRECFKKAIEQGAELIATAHHMDDNAETVIFNLVRGSALAGLTGIRDGGYIVRPLIGCSGGEIDKYIKENQIPYVTDSTNLSDAYTRNRIRHSVLPALEDVAPGAAACIYRFSRLAAEDEEYFSRKVREILVRRNGGYLIKFCSEPVIFKRAVRAVLSENSLKDFTAAQLGTVYEMQWLNAGKRFEFLGLVAIKEDGGISITFKDDLKGGGESVSFFDFLSGKTEFFGAEISVRKGEQAARKGCKILKFDFKKIPADAVIRFKRAGDRFKKFGGGTKSLSDFLTDKKVPQSMRGRLPLICSGDNVLIVGGVEISESVKLDRDSDSVGTILCPDPFL